MARDVSVKLELDSITKILARRGLQDNGPVQRAAASELKRMCDPYVPMLTGTLKNTAQVQQDGVLYVQPYAAKQHDANAGDGQGGTNHGGIRGKHWEKRMMADKGDEYIDKLAKIIGGKAK